MELNLIGPVRLRLDFPGLDSRAWRFAALLALTSVTLGTFGRSAEGDWPQFRGARASGRAEGCPPPTNWNLSTGENVLWRASIPGLAHASPIVWGGRVYVTTAVKASQAELKIGLYGDIDSVAEREPHQWRLLAFDQRNGHLVWDRIVHEGVPRQRRHLKSSQGNSTPATDGRYLVAILGSEGLFCLDLAGKLVWRKDLGPMDPGPYTTPSEQWGFGSSPVVHRGCVIVQCDGLSEQYLAAFDLRDGRQLWRRERREVATWCTPLIAEFDGQTQIIVNGWRQMGGYDFATGEERWRLAGGGDAPVASPVTAHGLVYLTSAHGNYRPMRAIRLAAAAGDITPATIDATNAAIAWVHPRQGNYLQTPIVVGQWLFGSTDYGLVTCFDARTGRIQYSERLRGRSQGFSASPVAADGKVYFTGELGDVFVVRAAPVFEVLACGRLEAQCLATPAISEGVLFFRTTESLLAIGSTSPIGGRRADLRTSVSTSGCGFPEPENLTQVTAWVRRPVRR